MSATPFLFYNGLLLRSSDATPVASLLEGNPGAYTTTRTHGNLRSILFWERHLCRLVKSTGILLHSNPELIFKSDDISHIPSLFLESPPNIQHGVRKLIYNSVTEPLKLALNESDGNDGEELAITVLVSGDSDKLSGIDKIPNEARVLNALNVWLHIGNYTPGLFGAQQNAAYLALVGRGRDVAAAKYSDWVRLRKPLEKLRPAMTTELLLSNDGDHILEGCVTNFFVIKRKNAGNFNLPHIYEGTHNFEVQTAPIKDGLLPGIIRELVIEVCLSKGIHVSELAPSWSEHELWEEAFVTNSLRIVQHVESIKVPTCSWHLFGSKRREEVSWKEKRFKKGAGTITQIVQEAIMERARCE